MSRKKIECLCVRRCPEGEGRYPVAPASRGDARFTPALVAEVAAVLAAHGFPVIEEGSEDWYPLMWVLVRFCWGAPVGQAGRAVLR